MEISFSKNDLNDFSKISGDKNPLHIDQDYARKTSYGEVVVFGILALIKSLPENIDRPIKNIKVRFLKAIFLDQVYTADCSFDLKSDKVAYTLLLGNASVMTVNLEFSSDKISDLSTFEATEQMHQSLKFESDLNLAEQKIQFSGQYSASSKYIEQILSTKKMSHSNYLQLQTLIFSSYQIGMISPGERALYLELSIGFTNLTHLSGAIIEYETKITKHDSRFDHLTYSLNIKSKNTLVASGSLKAFARPPASSNHQVIETYKNSTNTNFAGKNVLIIGGSRGLGAHVTALFASCGANCHVVYQNSVQDATILNNEFSNVSIYKADASDWEDMLKVRKALEEKKCTH